MDARHLPRLLSWLLLAGTAPGWAKAQEVALSGLSGGRALLVINGGQPRFLSPGHSRDGVRLLSVGSDSAVVDIGGVRQEIRLGQAPLSLQASPNRDAERIVLQADGGGHFMTPGQINGREVRFMVDTGATLVILSEADAQRIGLPFRNGRPVHIGTANGVVLGHEVRLNSVRVGSAQVYDVAGVVLPQALPFVLLGNSFLSRFQMQRTNEQMVLEKRF